MPELVAPTPLVRASYLVGEAATAREEGTDPSWLAEAAADFDAFARRRATVRSLWDVPVTELWFVDGAEYLGTLVIRHRLTTALTSDGGHIGYHVVPAHRGRGHATAMLAQALPVCRRLGLDEVLITCPVDNRPSRRVVERNGGFLNGVAAGVARYRVVTRSS